MTEGKREELRESKTEREGFRERGRWRKGKRDGEGYFWERQKVTWEE